MTELTAAAAAEGVTSANNNYGANVAKEDEKAATSICEADSPVNGEQIGGDKVDHEAKEPTDPAA